MAQQSESTSQALAASPAPQDGHTVEPGRVEPPPPPPPHPQLRIPRWLERFELLLRVMLRIYIGLMVCYVPWWPAFWDRNPLFQQFPFLGSIAGIGAVRGLVSGIGLLNLWVALEDILGRRGMSRERYEETTR